VVKIETEDGEFGEELDWTPATNYMGKDCNEK